MKDVQSLKEKSDDTYQNRPASEYFDIQLDLGQIFVPGKAYRDSHVVIVYCQCNCGAEMVIEGDVVRLERGDILLIQPGMFHTIQTYSKTGEPYVGYVVRVSRTFAQELVRKDRNLNPNFDRYQHVRTRGTQWDRIDLLFVMAMDETRQQSVGWENALLGCSIMLLTQVARAAIVDPSTGPKSEKNELLNNILSYVEKNLEEKITLENVAERFFVSASTVTHLFNKKMNTSFYKYVMQRRLWQAKNLITEGMPMEKIAVRVGFGDYSAFYRAFRQEYGMSPRQFSKNTTADGHNNG